MKTKRQETRTNTPAEPGLVFWISLTEAVRRFDVTREELISRVRDGRLQSRRILCEADLVVAVSSRELDVAFSLRPGNGLPKIELATEVESADLQGLRLELEDERISRARLEGELASSDKIERSLQRYSDRLEQELEASRKQAMTLARALGRAEQLATRSQAALSAPVRRVWWKIW